MALMILGALAVLATVAIVSSMSDRRLSGYGRDAAQALATAETGVAHAKRALIERTANMQDYDSDGRPDFELADSVAFGGEYHVIAEATDIKGTDISAYQSPGFTIVSEGRYHGACRRVKVEVEHDSFLKFARFSTANDLAFDCNTIATGEIYVGRNLSIPCGCGGGQDCVFEEMCYVVGQIANPGCALFMRGYEEGADSIDLNNSVNWDEVRDKARGLSTDNTCLGAGMVGVYLDLPGTDPLGLHAQPAPDTDVLVFDNFDFNNTTLQPPDTVVTYGGQAVVNPVTGQRLLSRDFNGIILFEGDAGVRGRVDGVSGRSMTVYGTRYVIIYNNIVTGHTGFDPVTRLPNNMGQPVNIGLVADEYIGLHENTPRVLRVDAALLSRKSDWRGLGDIASHPVAGPGPLDLDLDGIVGESPVNNDPLPGLGWDEMNIDADTWVLNLNGPIISTLTGDAKPWNLQQVINNADGPTRRYNYDMDIMDYPPPCFPLPIGLWRDVSWTEIRESQHDLASHLPN